MNFLKHKKTRRAVNKNYKSSLQLIYTDNINPPADTSISTIISVGNNSNISNQSESTLSKQSNEDEFAYSVDSSISKTLITKLASETSNFKESLQNWALSHNITHSATTDLLKILKEHQCFRQSLPSDSRSLLSTPRYSSVKDISPGQYIDFCWSDHIRNYIAANPNQVARLQVNIDGIPVYKSSNKSLWPILGNIEGTGAVFCIGIFHGPGKPNNVNDYLESFVCKFNELQTELGVDKVLLSALVCDAPARSFVSGIKNHTGYSCCAKCVARGSYKENRVIILETDADLRTDSTFRNKDDEDHHVDNTILVQLNFDIVRDIPYEYMHLICLGVTRKLLYLWTSAKKCHARLQKHQIDSIDTRLRLISKYTPCEFSRKPRSLRELDHWKATELRQFLLYTGPVVLYNILPQNQYHNFLSLVVAVTILLKKSTYLQYNSYANQLLIYFVNGFKSLYGEKYVSYNVHGLVHVAADALHHGPLDKYSGFKFENHLQKIKYLIRSPFNALQQVHNRIVELENLPAKHQISSKGFEKEINNNTQTDITGTSFYRFSTSEFCIKLSPGNNCVQLTTGEIGLVKALVETVDKNQVIIFRELLVSRDLFSSPCQSSFINIKVADKLKDKCVKSVKEISAKLYLIPLDKYFVCIPLVHQD